MREFRLARGLLANKPPEYWSNIFPVFIWLGPRRLRPCFISYQGRGAAWWMFTMIYTDNRFENSLTTLCLFRFNQMQWWLMAGLEKWHGNWYFLFEFHRFFGQILGGNPLYRMGHQRLPENKHTPLSWTVASQKILLLHSHRPQSLHYNSALLSFGFWLWLITIG